MDDLDSLSLVKFYSGLFKQHGFDSKSTGYSVQGQQIRYKVMGSINPLQGKEVLEIGSGLGHFCQYLKNVVPSAHYTGYDINKAFVAEATSKVGPYFCFKNILNEKVNKQFDIVFSIGILNTKIQDNVSTTKELIRAMFDICSEFIALSMTSIYVDKEWVHDYMFYYDPAEIFTFAKTLTRNVILIHDYLPHDFTIVLKKG